jgi:succinate dehydrogenase/fumarate reductase flavoprotein subunit
MQPAQARGDDRPIVVLGGGLAGGNAAATLREQGFKGRLTPARCWS